MDPIRIAAALSAAPFPSASAPAGGPVMEAARGFAATLAAAETQAVSALTTGADPHDLMAAIAESRLAVETVVTIRDRAVDAYQELLRMPV